MTSWWVHRELQMPENRADHLALRDGSDDPQRTPRTPRAACHVQGKNALSAAVPTWRLFQPA
jgi:hypothetical protein